MKILKIVMSLALMAAAAIAQTQQVSLRAVPPPAVTFVQASVVGTPGAAVACYWVVANYVGGGILSPQPAACLNNIPGSLSMSNYVNISWQPLAGVVSYDVLKTANRSTQPTPGASIALATALTTTSTTDQGGSLSAYTITAFPYANVSTTISINNRDFTTPQYQFSGGFPFNVVGGTIQCSTNPSSSSGPCYILPTGTSNVVIGNVTTGFTIDSTGAALNTVYTVSANPTIAQVNAGFTLLTGATGQTLKVQRVLLQALGGAVATCTDVRISDTAGSPVDALTVAIAALTQNTVVTEGAASNVTVGTFAPSALTANAGLQIRKTGSACATATTIRVVVFYSINS